MSSIATKQYWFIFAVVKERKRRQLAEARIEALEKSSRRLVQQYDRRIVELAKQVI